MHYKRAKMRTDYEDGRPELAGNPNFKSPHSVAGCRVERGVPEQIGIPPRAKVSLAPQRKGNVTGRAVLVGIG
jgi:hypothetical protein